MTTAVRPRRRAETIDDQLSDVHAWTAIFLAGGRVISIAALRGWPGAVEHIPHEPCRA